MKRQKLRKLLILISLLLFPVTLYYFSPALIINAGLQGIINGSFLVFLLMFLLSIPFGRLFCSYLCPAGGLQECAFAVNDRRPKQGWRNYIKYIIWVIWILAVIFCYFQKKKITAIDFFFETEFGISVSSIQSYVIYYMILCLILVPSVLAGKRTFCHYFCWMAPFMVLGTKLRRLLHLPGVTVRATGQSSCISCGKCNQVCPMGIDVVSEIKNPGIDASSEGNIPGIDASSGQNRNTPGIDNSECIQCGACIDHCPKHVLAYRMTKGKETTPFGDT